MFIIVHILDRNFSLLFNDIKGRTEIILNSFIL